MNTFKFEGETFRDLDHDGILSPYEDWRLAPEIRAKDLLERLTLQEKIGLLLHPTLPALGPMGIIGVGAEYDLDAVEKLILESSISTAGCGLQVSPTKLAKQNNLIQEIAAGSRHGIPLTISTDPRHYRSGIIGAGIENAGFTSWPGPLGMAASRNPELVTAFGNVVRMEYRATGLHMALSPQADLATSPQWPRIDGTFGEESNLVRRLVGAYVEGVQGGTSGLTPRSVISVVKHWVGYGAAPSGFDGHNYYGRFSAFPGGAFADHVNAFLDAFKNQVGGVMPTYNILKNLEFNNKLVEQVGAGYCRELLTDLLRDKCGFKGVILSDWAIAKDVNDACRFGEPAQTPADISMAWGVENLSRAERFAKGLNAGLDQFGGEDEPAPLLEAFHQGLIDESRLDRSAYRVLLQKFELGLFEDPFVDIDSVDSIVGEYASHELARVAHRDSYVFVKKTTQLNSDITLYVEGMDSEPFEAKGITLVAKPEKADLALISMSTPYQLLHPNFFFGALQHEGDLDFKDDDPQLVRLESLADLLPVIVVIEMDRPAILTNILDLSSTLIASFGGSHDSLVELLVSQNTSGGSLPFSLPASMEAVAEAFPDKAGSNLKLLFPSGYKL